MLFKCALFKSALFKCYLMTFYKKNRITIGNITLISFQKNSFCAFLSFSDPRVNFKI